MKKHTKGALAAGTAALLLLGGAGSLAYWSDSEAFGAGSISSGHLSLTDGTVSSDWVYAPGNADAGQPVTTIVPGDSIVSTHTFTINASGDNLTAKLTTPSTVDAAISGNDADSLQLPVSVSYDVDGAAVPATITSANDGDELTATIKVDFPYGDTTVNANDTQDIVASLDDVAITLEQTQSSGS